MTARNTKAPVTLDRLAGAVAVFTRGNKDRKILPFSGSTVKTAGSGRTGQPEAPRPTQAAYLGDHSRPQGARSREARMARRTPRKSPARRKWGLAPMSKESAGDREPQGLSVSVRPSPMSNLKLETKHDYNRMKVYRERNRVLLSIGFSSYKDYLGSSLWAAIRDRFLAAHKVCFGCGGEAVQVHHRCYTKKVLEGRGTNYLYAVCRSCHERIEFRDRDGMKLSPRQATNKLKQIARRSK